MTRALAASGVIAIFAVFFALHAALGISSNRDEIESLRWDVEYDIQFEIQSLESEIESLRRDVQYILSTLDP
jgi:hypothetical protein